MYSLSRLTGPLPQEVREDTEEARQGQKRGERKRQKDTEQGYEGSGVGLSRQKQPKRGARLSPLHTPWLLIPGFVPYRRAAYPRVGKGRVFQKLDFPLHSGLQNPRTLSWCVWRGRGLGGQGKELPCLVPGEGDEAQAKVWEVDKMWYSSGVVSGRQRAHCPLSVPREPPRPSLATIPPASLAGQHGSPHSPAPTVLGTQYLPAPPPALPGTAVSMASSKHPN